MRSCCRRRAAARCRAELGRHINGRSRRSLRPEKEGNMRRVADGVQRSAATSPATAEGTRKRDRWAAAVGRAPGACSSAREVGG